MLRLIAKNNFGELPVTLADMAQHLKREDTVEDDEYIEACLMAAIDWAEQFTGLIMIDQTFDFFTDTFPDNGGSIFLPRGPILEIQSLNYRDSGSVETALGMSGYSIDYAGRSLYLPATATWPTTDGARSAVRVRFRAGFIDMTGSPGPDGDLPAAIKQAIKIAGATFYANREDEPSDQVNASRVPYGAEALLRLYRIDDSMA